MDLFFNRPKYVKQRQRCPTCDKWLEEELEVLQSGVQVQCLGCGQILLGPSRP